MSTPNPDDFSLEVTMIELLRLKMNELKPLPIPGGGELGPRLWLWAEARFEQANPKLYAYYEANRSKYHHFLDVLSVGLGGGPAEDIVVFFNFAKFPDEEEAQ